MELQILSYEHGKKHVESITVATSVQSLVTIQQGGVSVQITTTINNCC